MRSSNIEEVREALVRICAKPVLISTGGIDAIEAIMNYCPINNAWLYYRTYGVGVQSTYPETDSFLQLIPLRGNGEIVIGDTTMPLAAGTTAVISPGTSWQMRCSADYEHLILKIDAQSLTQKLEAITGAAICEPLQMKVQQDSTCQRVGILPRYVRVLVDTLSHANPNDDLPVWWSMQTEQLLMTMMLSCNRHNYSHLLDEAAPDSAPAQVRRAEDYLEANWQRPITLDEVATAVGVSGRSLDDSFRKYRGYSPQEFLAQMRARGRGRLQ